MNIVRKTLTINGLAALLLGCGFGSHTIPQSASVPYDYTLGVASSLSAARAALPNSVLTLLPYDAPNGKSYSTLSQAHTILNAGVGPIAAIDTGAENAWTDGWTGKGVKIGIADSFNNNERLDAHGDWVSVVISSVAPEATVDMQHVLTGDASDIDSAYRHFEENGYHIINNSWGIDKAERNVSGAYTGNLVSGFDAMVADSVAAYDPTDQSLAVGLYIYAAGNGARYCDSKRVEDCNFLAGVTDGIRDRGIQDYGSRMIFVGSISDDNVAMASYSYQAGDLKYDFIVAHDDVLSPGDASGTSFAAPRVSAAAALVKNKFPNLTSANIKQVLLQTATDMGATGVDEVYGYGKLNIAGALSPIGNVTSR